MTRAGAKLRAVGLAGALLVAACVPARPVMVCPVGEAGWGEARLAVEGIAAETRPDGVRLTARVLDAERRQPVAGANVLVVGENRGAAANLDGRFALDGLLAGHRLRVSAIGYATYDLSADALVGALRR